MREMAYARCLTKGARRIGQDVLMGLYTQAELQDTGLLTPEETQFAEYTEVSENSGEDS